MIEITFLIVMPCSDGLTNSEIVCNLHCHCHHIQYCLMTMSLDATFKAIV